MKVAELKKILESVPDDLDVVVSGSDHSFFKAGKPHVRKAEVIGSHLCQYYDERNKSDPENKVIEVLWIDDGNY